MNSELDLKSLTYEDAFKLYNRIAREFDKPRKTIGDFITLKELRSMANLLYKRSYGFEPFHVNGFYDYTDFVGWAPLETKEDSD